MREFAIKAGKFVAAAFACTIASTVVWECFVAGTIYRCTDQGVLEFLFPGEWAHIHYGDTLRAGWSMTGLWCLWYSFVIVSAVVSFTFAMLPRRSQSSHGHLTHNAFNHALQRRPAGQSSGLDNWTRSRPLDGPCGPCADGAILFGASQAPQMSAIVAADRAFAFPTPPR